MASDTSNYPDFVFIAYDEDFSAQTHDVAVSLEAGNLVGTPVKYVRHDLNTRPAPAEDEVTIPRNPTEAMMNAGLYHCSHDMEWSDLYTAWQTMFDAVTLDGGMTEHAKASAAPAATDTGLVTYRVEAQEDTYYENGHYHSEGWDVAVIEDPEGDYVLRSQAEELLAAERAAQQRLLDIIEEANDDKEALEAKLAAAEKVREAAIELDEAISDDFNIFGAQQKLRAVLGGKPSC